MAAHNELGQWGEQVAAEYLENKGWRILHKDWKYKHKDIDIVCVDHTTNTIVFVEVKTRSPGALVSGERAVTKSKRGFLVRAAEIYYRRYKKEHGEALCRFDVASAVIENGRIISVKYYVNAFDAGT
jgi:putative endonuclease